MTCEIAILNKRGIALATDSAATLTSDKIFNSADKLFTLSKYEPVGIMIYGSSSINGVPWELLIKEYRNNLLKDTNFEKLSDYYDNFLDYIKNCSQIKDSKQIIVDFLNIFISLYLSYSKEKGFISFEKNNFDTASYEFQERFEKFKDDESFAEVKIDEKEYISKVFSNKISNYYIEKLNELFSLYIKKKYSKGLTSFSSGIAIVGFGKKDFYPKIINCEILGKIYSKIKFTEIEYDEISNKQNAIIAPFAQREMTDLFMSGILKKRENKILQYINKYQSILLKVIKENIDESLYRNIENSAQNTLKELYRAIDIEDKKYSSEIIKLVSVLNKEEMINLAKSLIELQELKKTVSMDSPSVGGPVDIAFISKYDGFVWINRKLYFKEELNHRFFDNYYR